MNPKESGDRSLGKIFELKPDEAPGKLVIKTFQFTGAAASEMRTLQIVEDLSPVELVRVACENYSMYRALLAQGRPVMVQQPSSENWADFVNSPTIFPELKFEEPQKPAKPVPDLTFPVAIPERLLDEMRNDAKTYGLDLDTYLNESLQFERMVARVNTLNFPVMALDSVTSRTGTVVNFA